MTTPAIMLREFHDKFNVSGDFDNYEDRKLRLALMLEEVEELRVSLEEGNPLGTIDDLADICYVAFGIADMFHMDLIGAINEVHRSNMSKLDEKGNALINGINCPMDETRPKGKILKSNQFFEPDLEQFLPNSLRERLKEF